MKISIPLKDIMVAPGKRFDPAESSEQNVINRIRKVYGVIAKIIDVTIDGEMVHIEFQNATPEKHSEAMRNLHKGVKEARKGEIVKALKLFKKVLAVIPEIWMPAETWQRHILK